VEVISSLDEKIKLYQDKKQEIRDLRGNIDSMKKQILDDEILIKEKYLNVQSLKNEVIAVIRFGDLLQKMSYLKKISPGKMNGNITVLNGIYDESIEDISRREVKYFNSWISIESDSGSIICNRELPLFNSLIDVQADGVPLLDHCIIIPKKFKRGDLVVKDNIDDIICRFTLEAVDYNNYNDLFGYILPDTIRECINEGLVMDEPKQLIMWVKTHFFVKKIDNINKI